MAFKFAQTPSSASSGTPIKSNINRHCKQPTTTRNDGAPIVTRKPPPTPAWLKSNSSLKHFPKAYLGYLGQVQVQPSLESLEKNNNNGQTSQYMAKSRAISLDGWSDTSRVQQLLSTSKLSNESLAAIWAFCNKTRPGTMTNREVCLALALIAIFQRVHEQQLKGDPFALLKLEPVPPKPKLYETAREPATKVPSRLTSSASMPLDLGDLLINIDSDSSERLAETKTNHSHSTAVFSLSNNAINLIDMDDGRQFQPAKFLRLANVWHQTLVAMKDLFKRSFDVLNVENSRSNALEALRTPKGTQFCKHLSLCYCLSFNIADFVSSINSGNNKPRRFVNEDYLRRIEDLMISINEYWAVLINFFHQSGLIDFIELVMDGLTNKTQMVIKSESSESLQADNDEFLAFLDNRCNSRCAICMNEIFLSNIGDALEKLPQEDIELLFDAKLITLDECHYYHSKCANFWLNNVPDSNGELPFPTPGPAIEPNCAILKPTTNTKY